MRPSRRAPFDLPESRPSDLDDSGPSDLADTGPHDLADPEPFRFPVSRLRSDRDDAVIDLTERRQGSPVAGLGAPAARVTEESPAAESEDGPGDESGDATPAGTSARSGRRSGDGPSGRRALRRLVAAFVGIVFIVAGASIALIAGRAAVQAVDHPPASDQSTSEAALLPLSSMPAGTVVLPQSGVGSAACSEPRNPDAPDDVHQTVRTPSGIVMVEELAVDSGGGAPNLMAEARQHAGCATVSGGTSQARGSMILPLAVSRLVADQTSYQINAGQGSSPLMVDTVIMEVNPTTVLSVSTETVGGQPDVTATVAFARRALHRARAHGY